MVWGRCFFFSKVFPQFQPFVFVGKLHFIPLFLGKFIHGTGLQLSTKCLKTHQVYSVSAICTEDWNPSFLTNIYDTFVSLGWRLPTPISVLPLHHWLAGRGGEPLGRRQMCWIDASGAGHWGCINGWQMGFTMVGGHDMIPSVDQQELIWTEEIVDIMQVGIKEWPLARWISAWTPLVLW